MSFEKGEVVYLRSGSPAMTILSVEEPKGATCVWFEEGKFHSQVLATILLEKAED